MISTDTDYISEIDSLCAEFSYDGKNATEAIASNDEDAMWDLAEFFSLGEEPEMQHTFEFLKRKAAELKKITPISI